MNFIDAIILGVVEGLTEFLPISSTGHLILTGELLDIAHTDFLATFEVVIQLGAILAVVTLYFQRFLLDWDMNKKLIVGLVPAIVVGGLFYPFIKSLFAAPDVVAWALILGGAAILLIESWQEKRPKSVRSLDQVTYKEALMIGIFQSFAVIPGVSRAGATILGGLIIGMERSVIVEFSFLLAVPTMIAASSKDLYENLSTFQSTDIHLLIAGFVTSYIVAILAIRFFIRFVQTHTFKVFGWYRIVIGIAFLLFIL